MAEVLPDGHLAVEREKKRGGGKGGSESAGGATAGRPGETDASHRFVLAAVSRPKRKRKKGRGEGSQYVRDLERRGQPRPRTAQDLWANIYLPLRLQR